MSVFIAAVGPETAPHRGIRSIYELQRPPGSVQMESYDTLGHIARLRLMRAFYREKEFQHIDWIFLCDTDMLFERDTLMRLLETAGRDKKVVAGLCTRRMYNPMSLPLYKDDPTFTWPMEPLLDIPGDEPFTVGGTGFASILIHRDVLRDMERDVLAGEPWVHISTLCWWPFDHKWVDKTLTDLPKLIASGDAGEAFSLASQLRRVMRLNRGEKSIIGADIRFCFYARAAGHRIWVDPRVKPGHFGMYPFGYGDYKAQGDDMHEETINTMRRIAEARKEGNASQMATAQTLKEYYERKLQLARQKVAAFNVQANEQRRQYEERIAELARQNGVPKAEAEIAEYRAKLDALDALGKAPDEPDALDDFFSSLERADDAVREFNSQVISQAAQHLDDLIVSSVDGHSEPA